MPLVPHPIWGAIEVPDNGSGSNLPAAAGVIALTPYARALANSGHRDPIHKFQRASLDVCRRAAASQCTKAEAIDQLKKLAHANNFYGLTEQDIEDRVIEQIQLCETANHPERTGQSASGMPLFPPDRRYQREGWFEERAIYERRGRVAERAPEREPPEWQAREQREREQAEDAQAPASGLNEWDAGEDPGPIPPRQWLLGNQFCRGFISSIVAAGGAGKSALRLVQYISLAAERALSAQHVFCRSRVLLISLEDDKNEQQRRIQAVLNHYNLERKDIKGWLFCANIKLAKLAEMKNRIRTIGPLEQQLREAIERLKPDLVALDPFVKTHSLIENDSGDMDFVCDILSQLGTEYDIAVDSPHHVHKGQISPGDADSGRGSSGIKDAGRLIYTLVPMSEDEAKTFNVPVSDRKLYVRLDSAKVNLAASSSQATWFKLVGVPIGNGTPEYPNGDSIQVVEPWSPPEAWDGLSTDVLNAVLSEIDRGLVDAHGKPNGRRYSSAPSTKGNRAAWRVVQRHCPDRSEAQCRQVIRTWELNDVIVTQDYDDPKERKSRGGLFVNDTARPGSKTAP